MSRVCIFGFLSQREEEGFESEENDRDIPQMAHEAFRDVPILSVRLTGTCKSAFFGIWVLGTRPPKMFAKYRRLLSEYLFTFWSFIHKLFRVETNLKVL